MVRRPLCILCFIFLAAVTLIVCVLPSEDLQKKRQVTAVGEIYYRENGTNNNIFYLKDIYLNESSRSGDSQNLIIYLSKNITYPIGTILQVKGTLFPLETASNPGQFDAHIYYRAKGVGGRLLADKAQVLKEAQGLKGLAGLWSNWKEWLLCQRDSWCESLGLLFGTEAAGVLQAMLFGVTSDVPAELEGMYQILGVGHLLAISGLHVTMLGGTLYKGIRRLGAPFWGAALTASFFLLSYQEMLGFCCSALRAIGMFLLFLGAQVAGRAYDRLTALAFSAACLVWYQPMLVLTGGFWLSVTAAFGAAVGLERKEEMQRCDKAKENSLSFIGYIQAFLLPVQLYFYYELAVYGILWNLLLVPAAGLVLFGGILALAMSYISYPLGVFVGGMAEAVLGLYHLAGCLGEKLPRAVYICGKPKIWQMIVYYAALAGWMYLGWPGGQTDLAECKGGRCLGRFTGQRRKLCCRASGLLFLGAACSVIFLRFHAPLEVSFLDVGQGDCAVIREENGLCMLMDGGSLDVDKVWNYRIYPFLKHEKISRLDYVFASHGDTDHISGLLEMFEKDHISVRYLVCSAGAGEKLDELKQLARMRGTKLMELSAGSILRSDTMQIACLGPVGTVSLSENDKSLVLLLESHGVRFLFTGDMEAAEERSILQSALAEGLAADVLKVAHHGSAGSSSEELLSRISPLLSVISCGEDNVYGHPHEETLERLKSIGSEILATSECGAVTVRVTDGKMEVRRWNKAE